MYFMQMQRNFTECTIPNIGTRMKECFETLWQHFWSLVSTVSSWLFHDSFNFLVNNWARHPLNCFRKLSRPANINVWIMLNSSTIQVLWLTIHLLWHSLHHSFNNLLSFLILYVKNSTLRKFTSWFSYKDTHAL